MELLGQFAMVVILNSKEQKIAKIHLIEKLPLGLRNIRHNTSSLCCAGLIIIPNDIAQSCLRESSRSCFC